MMKNKQIFVVIAAGIIIVGILVIFAGVAAPKFMNILQNTEKETVQPLQETSQIPEVEPAASRENACHAKCRNDYGGSGSPGFDACIRACGEGGVLREQACPSPGPACPSPQTPVCNNGTWYCRENVSAAEEGGISPETSEVDLNYPTEEQLREAACGEPALACPSPEIPDCRNGQWICIGPASPS